MRQLVIPIPFTARWLVLPMCTTLTDQDVVVLKLIDLGEDPWDWEVVG